MKSVCFSGREVEVALGPLQIPLAEQAAGTQRNFRLQDVISGAKRVRFGIEERQDARLLIVVQELPGDRPGAESEHNAHTDLPRLDTCQEQHDPAAKREQQRRPQIGLTQDQRGGREDHQQRRQVGPDASEPVQGDAVEIARESQHQPDLHELRRLQLDDAEVDPALCAHDRRAEQFHADQQGEGEAVNRVRRAQPEADVDHGNGEHHDEARAEPDHLARRPRFGGTARGRNQHPDADRADGADEDDQEPVELEETLGDPKALMAANLQLRHQAVSLGRGTGVRERARADGSRR